LSAPGKYDKPEWLDSMNSKNHVILFRPMAATQKPTAEK